MHSHCTGGPGSILIVPAPEDYITLGTAACGAGQPNAFPVLAGDSRMMLRLQRWRPGLQCETAGVADPTLRDKVVKRLGLKQARSWAECDAAEVFSALLAARGAKAQGGHWLVAFRDEPWCALLAAMRAAHDARPLILLPGAGDDACMARLIGVAPEPPRSLYVVTETLTTRKIRWIQQQIASIAPHPGRQPFPCLIPHGFLNARSFALMTFLDLKQRFPGTPPGKHVIVVPTLDGPPPPVQMDCLTLTRENASVAALKGEAAGICSLTAHGRSDLAFVGQDRLCGLADGVTPDDLCGEDRVPACMGAPYECFRPEGERLRMSELPARHVFINSCGSLGVADSEFGGRFNLSYSALEGHAESFTGTLRWKDGDSLESFLFAYALVDGYSLGEAVALLNASLQCAHFERDRDVFVLLGDPAARLQRGMPEPSVETVVTSTARPVLARPFKQVFFADPDLARLGGAGRLTLSLRGVPGAFSLACPAAGAAGAADTSGAACAPGAGLLVSILAPFATDLPRDLELECGGDSPGVEQALNAYRHLATQLDPALGLRRYYPPQIVKGIKADLDSRMAALAAQYKLAFTRPHLTPRVASLAREFMSLIEAADELTCQHLHQTFTRTNFRLSEHYQGVFLLNETPSPALRCYICGEAVVVRSQRSIARPGITRDEHVCINCGGLEDKPDNDFRLELLGGEARRGDGTGTVALTVINNTGLEQRGYGCVAVRNAARWGLLITPEVKAYSVAPWGRATGVFTLEPGDAPAHRHALQGAFINCQRLYLAMRPFWLTK